MVRRLRVSDQLWILEELPIVFVKADACLHLLDRHYHLVLRIRLHRLMHSCEGVFQIIKGLDVLQVHGVLLLFFNVFELDSFLQNLLA